MDQKIPVRVPDLVLIDKDKRNCNTVDFSVSAEHRLKVRESEKSDKYMDVAKSLWNMKITAIPIIVGALETISRNLEMRFDELGRR